MFKYLMITHSKPEIIIRFWRRILSRDRLPFSFTEYVTHSPLINARPLHPVDTLQTHTHTKHIITYQTAWHTTTWIAQILITYVVGPSCRNRNSRWNDCDCNSKQIIICIAEILYNTKGCGDQCKWQSQNA